MWMKNRSDSVFGIPEPTNDEVENFIEMYSTDKFESLIQEDENNPEDLCETTNEETPEEKPNSSDKEEEIALKIENGVFALNTETGDRFLRVNNFTIPKGNIKHEISRACEFEY